MAKKERAVAVIIDDGKILIIHRFKSGEEYYVFPGGGVENNEPVEEAVIREAKEETGLDITIAKKLWESENKGRKEHFFLVDKFSGELRSGIGGPEESTQSADNVYRLEWLPLSDIKNVRLFPEPMKEKVLEEFLK